MALIKHGTLAADIWHRYDDDTPLQADIPALVSLERWRTEREDILASTADVGVVLRSDQHPNAIAGDLARLQVVALDFPAFTDGRAYSYARLLRERLGYEGEVRAIGNVLRDQYLFMQRTGFDAFEVPDGASTRAFLEAISEVDLFYQASADGAATVWQRRHGHAQPIPAAAE